jgi:hypothetical protein
MLYVGIGGGCALLFMVGLAIIAAVSWAYVKNQGAATPAAKKTVQGTPAVAPKKGEPAKPGPNPAAPPEPLRAELFLNSRDDLAPALQNHYFDFLLLYPASWTSETKARQGEFFVDLRGRPSGSDLSAETFSVGFWARDRKRSDQAKMETEAKTLSDNFAKGMRNYQQLSLAPGKLGNLEGLELKFSAEHTDGKAFGGRVLFLSPQSDEQEAAPVVYLIATELAKDVHGANDVGLKGSLPLLVNTFRWGAEAARANAAMNKLPTRAEVLFSLLDLDGDKALSGLELLDGQLLRFDRDGDGRVSLQEFMAANPSQ